MNHSPTRFLAAAAAFTATGAFALLPLWSDTLSPSAYEGGRSRDAEARAVRNTSSVAAMLGEVRTAMSDIMFIKTERYLHSGVAFVPHLEEEVLSVSGAMAEVTEHLEETCSGSHACAEEHGAEEEAHETIIRSAQDDFRGFIGHLERQVKPYFGPDAPHTHTDGTELLPWFRVMTISDPHYLPGYTTGAWWLSSRRPEEALAFIEEGVRNNPDSFQVHLAKGQILLKMAREASPDLGAAEGPAREKRDLARASFARAGELARAAWLALGMGPSDADYLSEDARTSMRLHAMMEHQFGDGLEARRLAEDYLDVVEEDRNLARLAGEEAAGS